MQEWFPDLPVALPSQPSAEEETLEDTCAQMIAHAKRLDPLKSKEAPRVSASSCVHPKSSLKGGGNQASSYIVCKQCHSRWQSTLRASEIKNSLKEDKKKMTGHLSQVAKDTSASAPTTPVCANQDQRRDRQDGAGAENGVHAEGDPSTAVRVETERYSPTSSGERTSEGRGANGSAAKLSDQSHSRSPEGASNAPAQRLEVKNKGPWKGHRFWKCVQRECDFFLWENRETSDAMSVEFFSMISSENPKDVQEPKDNLNRHAGTLAGSHPNQSRAPEAAR